MRSSYPEAVNTWNGVLENGADLRVNERQKIRHYCARSTEERRRRRRRRRNSGFFYFTRRVRKIALYSDLILMLF